MTAAGTHQYLIACITRVAHTVSAASCPLLSCGHCRLPHALQGLSLQGFCGLGALTGLRCLHVLTVSHPLDDCVLRSLAALALLEDLHLCNIQAGCRCILPCKRCVAGPCMRMRAQRAHSSW